MCAINFYATSIHKRAIAPSDLIQNLIIDKTLKIIISNNYSLLLFKDKRKQLLTIFFKIMPTKGKGKKKNGNGKTAKGGNNGGKSSKKTKRSGGKSRFTMDIFNEEVMENAYYTCHNIMDVLNSRGFPWPEAQKKKKKKGKK